MQYRSVNHLTDFEFHDAFMRLKRYDDTTLAVSISNLNIHKNIEQNPTDRDLEIPCAVLTLENFRLESLETETEAKSFTENESANILKELLTHEMQLLDFEQLEKNRYSFYISINPAFYFNNKVPLFAFTFRFSCDSAIVTWENYSKPAWYENP